MKHPRYLRWWKLVRCNNQATILIGPGTFACTYSNVHRLLPNLLSNTFIHPFSSCKERRIITPRKWGRQQSSNNGSKPKGGSRKVPHHEVIRGRSSHPYFSANLDIDADSKWLLKLVYIFILNELHIHIFLSEYGY